jgi:hypothetical protein
MTVVRPHDVIQKAVRRKKEQMIDLKGVNAVIYRFIGEYDEPLGQDPRDKLYEDSNLTTSDSKYDDAFESHVVVNYPDEIELTESGKLNVYGDEPIEAEFKFNDYITERSYIKVPFSHVHYENKGESAFTDVSEKQSVVRLEVNNLLLDGKDVQKSIKAEMAIKRGDGDRADSDTSDKSDIDNQNEFFEVG